MEIQTRVAPAELWLRDDLENIYALLFRFLGFGFRLAMSNAGLHVTQKFAILVPDPIAFAQWPVASLVTVVNKTDHRLSSGYVCIVELVKGLGCGRCNFPRSAAQWGLHSE